MRRAHVTPWDVIAREQRAPRAASGGLVEHRGEPALVRWHLQAGFLASSDERDAACVDRSCPTLGLRVYVGSSRVREGFPRLCPRPLGLAAPGGVRTSARSRQHERSYATLATGHEVGGSETSVSSTPRVAYFQNATPVPTVRQAEISRFKRPLRRSNTPGVPESARSGRRERRTESAPADREATP